MLAKVVKGVYDAEGAPVGKVHASKWFRPTYPIAAYMTQPLTVRCKDLNELRAFLRTCTYVSDKEEHGELDYWTPPEEFEKTRRGDCDCFAMWTWRQLTDMGYTARFTLGKLSGWRGGHAWVMLERDGEWWLLEPLAAKIGMQIARFSTLKYQPQASVDWVNDHAQYYVRAQTTTAPHCRLLIWLIAESCVYSLVTGPKITWMWIKWFAYCVSPRGRHNGCANPKSGRSAKVVKRWMKRTWRG